jgi:hypothetical protein
MNLSFVGNMSKAKFILLTTHASDEKWHYFLAEEDAFLVMTKWSSFGERNRNKKGKTKSGLDFCSPKITSFLHLRRFYSKIFFFMDVKRLTALYPTKSINLVLLIGYITCLF